MWLSTVLTKLSSCGICVVYFKINIASIKTIPIIISCFPSMCFRVIIKSHWRVYTNRAVRKVVLAI